MLVPVIISGGAGSRLWPVSREFHPKPFMQVDEHSLIQKTFLRAAKLHEVGDIITVTSQDTLFLTRDAYLGLKSKKKQHFILEPIGRNTAPAIAASALCAQKLFGDDAVLLIMAADHLIQKCDLFQEAVQQAIELAKAGRIVTFGIQPSTPETGYGYIESNGTDVIRFIEKPDYQHAVEYVEAGFLWNAGIFCFTVGTILDELNKYAAEVIEHVQKALDLSVVNDEYEYILDLEEFVQAPDISIDYAIMEKSAKVSVVSCDIGWSDIGSWDSLSELTASDENGNQLDNNTDAILVNSRNNYIKSNGNRMIAAVGVDDLIIVDTPDALLIASRASAQDVKKVVTQLKKAKHESCQLHRTVSRPWGTYTTLEEGNGFKMKRIAVKPGGSLSLQMHHHRSEHWIVVSGTAKVVNGEKEMLLYPNESTYIPAGQTHRLTNPGVIECVLIEVQVGVYLGEDDIVRFSDIYGRVG